MYSSSVLSAIFIEKFRELLKGKEMLQAISRVQEYAIRPILDELFTEEKLGDRNLRDETIY